ncbi:MAG: hypothetical protein WB500_03475, partial [Rhodoplanes sp.]
MLAMLASPAGLAMVPLPAVKRLIFSLGGKVAGRGNCATGCKKEMELFAELREKNIRKCDRGCPWHEQVGRI